MWTALQSGRCYGPEIGQERDGPGLILFVGRQQDPGGVAVLILCCLRKDKSLLDLFSTVFVFCHGEDSADMPIEQFTVQCGILFVHTLRNAVMGALLRRDRRDRKADAPAPDGRKDACQRIRGQKEQHALRRLFHDLQQGIGRLLIHPLDVIEQDGAALRRKAGIENLAPHRLDLTDEIAAIGTHTGHRDSFPDDAGLDPAAVTVTGLTDGTAALAAQ